MNIILHFLIFDFLFCIVLCASDRASALARPTRAQDTDLQVLRMRGHQSPTHALNNSHQPSRLTERDERSHNGRDLTHPSPSNCRSIVADNMAARWQ